nr:protease inhibitor I42 family protein [Francisella halioticida]
MLQIFRVLGILCVFVPSLALAEMTQSEVDKLHIKLIALDEKHHTFNVELPVDSTDGYRWFLVPPDYDYVDDVGYTHKSADIENSKWGGMDNFKLELTSKFRKVPYKFVLHFECFRAFENNPQILKKDVVVLSILN